MKTLLALSASAFLLSLATGCQNRPNITSATSAPQAGQLQTSSPGVGAQEVQTQDADEAAANADQPDDPGMTTAHDKTIKQEAPSGDESSRAAPNEGDAEPPQ